MTIKDKEKELAIILGEIPVYTMIHQVRLEKLRKLTSFRIEIERLFEYLANEYRKPCFTTMVIERVRTPPKSKLNIILTFKLLVADPVRYVTFNIYWDFLLRFFKNC